MPANMYSVDLFAAYSSALYSPEVSFINTLVALSNPS